MSLTTTTSPTNLASYEAINNQIRGEFLMNFEPRKYMMRFATAPIVDTTGFDKAVRPIAPRLDITPMQARLQEGITPVAQDFDLSAVEVDTEQYGIYYKMSDRFLSKTQNLPSIVQKATMNLSDAMERVSDRVIQDQVIDNATNVVFAAPSVGGARRPNRASIATGDIMRADDLEYIAFLLDVNEAPVHPETGTYVGIISAQANRQLRQDNTVNNSFSDTVKYQAPELILGTNFVGQYAGITLFCSQNLKTYNSTVKVYPAVFFGDQAYGVATLGANDMEIFYKPLGSGGTEDPMNQRATIGVKYDFAATILQQNSLVVFEGAGS